MRDSLKQHIESSREEFELYPFDSDKEWVKLAKKVKPGKEQRDPWKLAGIAACIVAIVVGTIFYMNPSSKNGGNEIAELEQFYNGEINQKITLIKGQLEDDYILQDLEDMDAAFVELKADLKDNLDNQEVISAMMENYRLKLQILEEILNELEKEKREEVL
jgi:hypothetical protein